MTVSVNLGTGPKLWTNFLNACSDSLILRWSGSITYDEWIARFQIEAEKNGIKYYPTAYVKAEEGTRDNEGILIDGVIRVGWVLFSDEETMTMFILKWS